MHIGGAREPQLPYPFKFNTIINPAPTHLLLGNGGIKLLLHLAEFGLDNGQVALGLQSKALDRLRRFITRISGAGPC